MAKTFRGVSALERAEELKLLHAAGDDGWWGRPDIQTAEEVWRLVAPTLPEKLQALAPDPTARQVFAVALARCVQIGDEPAGKTKVQRAKRRTFSQNHLFDAVAPKWSRTFKAVAETGRPGFVPTPNVYAQTWASAEEARRQLLAVGVRLADIWEIIVKSGWSKKKTGTNPLFCLTRTPKLGYRVHLEDSEELAQFRRVMPVSIGQSPRLLLETDPLPSRRDRYQICAEQPFNGVEEDENVIALLETMERTRLRFHARRFIADYSQWDEIVKAVGRWKERVPYDQRGPFARRVRVGRRLQSELAAHRQILVDLHRIARGRMANVPETLLIKTQMFRDQEGRFHARHFWPVQISGRLTQIRRTNLGLARSSYRDRWFSDRDGRRLAGYDIASSQTQILAILLGLDDLELLTRGTTFKMKRFLAERALAEQLPLRITSKSPAELVPLMKDLWTRVLYGGHLKEIVWDHFDMLVPGRFSRKQYLKAAREARRHPKNRRLAKRAKRYNDAIKCAEENLKDFLEGIPWYGKPGERKLSDFFRACELVARSARKRDIYAGVVLTDPFAGTMIQWNPPRRGRRRMNCQGLQVALKLPGGWTGKRGTRGRRFVDAIPHHKTGNYPVSLPKLKQAVAPGVVHLLDALFNALIVRALEQAGVQDAVALHDCWLVPVIVAQTLTEIPRHQAVLRDAIRAAGREWTEKLDGVYASLGDYLRGTEFGPWMEELREKCAERVRDGRWPEFRAEPQVGFMPVALEALLNATRSNVSHHREEPIVGSPASVVSSEKSTVSRREECRG
jgi:hypothetical protein